MAVISNGIELITKEGNREQGTGNKKQKLHQFRASVKKKMFFKMRSPKKNSVIISISCLKT
jgi:hypothetical protein